MSRHHASPPELFHELGLYYHSTISAENQRRADYTDPSYANWYIVSGEVTANGPWGSLRAGPGDWVCFDPFTRRDFHFSDHASLISIRFYVHLAGLNYLPPLTPPRHFPGGERPALARTALALLGVEPSPSAGEQALSYQCRLRGAFLSWLAEWHTQREVTHPSARVHLDRRVESVIQHLARQKSGGAVDYATLNRLCGLSRAQINRLFKTSTGLTPRQWLDAHILRQAQQAVSGDPTLSFKAIAFELGFHDPSHFCKWFQRKCGATPTAWRRRRQAV